MTVKVKVPGRIRERLLGEILAMYSSGELSAGRAAEMLGLPRAAFYQLLAERDVPLPTKLDESIQRELKSLAARK